MTDRQAPFSPETVDLAEKIAQHLMQNPCDLIDAKRLMRHFRASAAEVERALSRFEVLSSSKEEESAY